MKIKILRMNVGRVIFYHKNCKGRRGELLNAWIFSPAFGISEGPIRKELRSLPGQHMLLTNIFKRHEIPVYCVITAGMYRMFYYTHCFSKENRAFVCSGFIKYSRGRERHFFVF